MGIITGEVALRALNIEVISSCNHRCQTCMIWRHPPSLGISPEKLQKILADPLFRDLEEISITGGEPFLRADLPVLCKTIASETNVSRIFVNTNGSFPERVQSLVMEVAPLFKELFVCVSLEGSPATHNFMRGRLASSQALRTLELVAAGPPKTTPIISTTFTRHNLNERDWVYLRELQNTLNCRHTFRIVSMRELYYENDGEPDLKPSADQLAYLARVIRDLTDIDEYLAVLLAFLEGQTVPCSCTAGRSFAFLRSNGTMSACPWSAECLWSADQLGLPIQPALPIEACNDCVTECRLYPMFNYDSPMAQALFSTLLG
jgi:MoaA/NifB/PqqE/SkfB family radical SAM enzyme